MRPYIEAGRFGEFVSEIIIAENNRRKEQAEKEAEEMLWNAYIHSGSEKSFIDWKAEVMRPVEADNPKRAVKRDEDMTKEDIDNLMEHLFG